MQVDPKAYREEPFLEQPPRRERRVMRAIPVAISMAAGAVGLAAAFGLFPSWLIAGVFAGVGFASSLWSHRN